jgi:hypothetical protein
MRMEIETPAHAASVALELGKPTGDAVSAWLQPAPGKRSDDITHTLAGEHFEVW